MNIVDFYTELLLLKHFRYNIIFDKEYGQWFLDTVLYSYSSASQRNLFEDIPSAMSGSNLYRAIKAQIQVVVDTDNQSISIDSESS